MIKAAISVPAMLAGLALAGAALAQSAPSLQAFRAANVAIAAAVGQADLAGKAPPTLADPDVAPQVRTALDPSVLALLDPGDVGGLMDACTAGSTVGRGYVLFGLKAKIAALPDGAKAPPDTLMQATIAVANANTVRFQDEIALANRFNVACNARALPAVARFAQALPAADRTPARREALIGIRKHAAETYQGVVLTQLDPIKAENRRIVLDEALSRLDVYAAAMGPAERQSVIQVIDRVAPTPGLTPETKEKLQRLRTGLGRTDCTGLCNLWADAPAG